MSKTFLHVGCGPARKEQTVRGFNTPEWAELRFDIDESVNPDIVWLDAGHECGTRQLR